MFTLIYMIKIYVFIKQLKYYRNSSEERGNNLVTNYNSLYHLLNVILIQRSPCSEILHFCTDGFHTWFTVFLFTHFPHIIQNYFSVHMHDTSLVLLSQLFKQFISHDQFHTISVNTRKTIASYQHCLMLFHLPDYFLCNKKIIFFSCSTVPIKLSGHILENEMSLILCKSM